MRAAVRSLSWSKLLLGALYALGALDPAAALGESPYDTDNPAAFVRVDDGWLMIGGDRFVMRGANYFGSWRAPMTLPNGQLGAEDATIWAFWQNWNPAALERDFAFLVSALHTTVIRVPLPSHSDFQPNVQLHGFTPWFEADGSISDRYAQEIVQLADIAARNDVRLELCFLWNVGNEIEQDRGAFMSGARMDQFYSRQVRSVTRLLARHPGVVGFSVGNEVLVRWQINGTHPSWYEPFAAGFILRRINDIRQEKPHQLVGSDEILANVEGTWHSPGSDFARLSDTTGSNGGQPIILADHVDYLGPHFYPVTFTARDTEGSYAAKLAGGLDRLKTYLAAAQARNKPVVLDEFGLIIQPESMRSSDYSAPRDELFRETLSTGQAVGLQGLLAWSALPRLVLRPGQYAVRESSINRFSHSEVDLTSASRPRRILFLQPFFNLFDWTPSGESPVPSLAARLLAAAWPTVPHPPTAVATVH